MEVDYAMVVATATLHSRFLTLAGATNPSKIVGGHCAAPSQCSSLSRMQILSAAVVCSCCYCIVLIIDLVIAAAVVVVVVNVVAVVLLLQFVLGGRNTHVDSSALSVHLPQKNQKFRTIQSPVLHVSRRAPPKYWGLRSQSLEER